MSILLNSAWTIGVGLAYIATAKIGFQYAVIGESVTLMWPPSGIALAAVLIGGYRFADAGFIHHKPRKFAGSPVRGGMAKAFQRTWMRPR
jgi:hypothetical protein